jgi:glycosyltransferase involved in cell wall biosynthesis
VIKYRKKFDYGCVSFAEQSVLLTFIQCVLLGFLRKPFYIVIHWGALPKFRFKFIYRYIFRNAKAVIGVSNEICRMYETHFPDVLFKYIPPLIPFDKEKNVDLRTQMGFAKESRIYLFVGTLKTMKNPDTIVQAAILLGKEFLERNNIRFVFAGHGHLSEELISKVRLNGLDSFFHFTGSLKREEIADFYSISDAYIIASDYEGTSLSLMEAMYNGLLIIASKVKGIDEMLSDNVNSLLFEVRNPRSLADQLVYSIAHWDDLHLLRKQAQNDYLERFSYGRMMDDYNTLFLNVN